MYGRLRRPELLVPPPKAVANLSCVAEIRSKEAVGARLGEIRAQLKLLADYL
jgi:hypothetical protein